MPIDPIIIPALEALQLTTGGIALVAAPLAMAAYKGGDWHRRCGKIFFYSMAAACLAAIVRGILVPADFWLAMLAVFGFHLIASGYRSLYLKKLHKGMRPGKVDIAMHGTAGAVYSGLLIWGLMFTFLDGISLHALLFSAIGLLGSAVVLNGFLQFNRQRQDKRMWLYGHIIGFGGGYCVLLTAFSLAYLDVAGALWLQVLVPALLGLLPVVAWLIRLRRRFAQGVHLRSFAKVRIR